MKYEVVAELRPPTRRPPPADTLETRLQRLGDSGSLTRTSIPKGEWNPERRGLGLPTSAVLRAVLESGTSPEIELATVDEHLLRALA